MTSPNPTSPPQLIFYFIRLFVEVDSIKGNPNHNHNLVAGRFRHGPRTSNRPLGRKSALVFLECHVCPSSSENSSFRAREAGRQTLFSTTGVKINREHTHFLRLLDQSCKCDWDTDCTFLIYFYTQKVGVSLKKKFLKRTKHFLWWQRGEIAQ